VKPFDLPRNHKIRGLSDLTDYVSGVLPTSTGGGGAISTRSDLNAVVVDHSQGLPPCLPQQKLLLALCVD
jgi:hypothetical protein